MRRFLRIVLPLLLVVPCLRADLTIEEVATDHTLWPSETTVQVPLQIPLVVNGNQAGTANSPAGRSCRVKSVTASEVILDINGVAVSVSPANTDILEKAKVIQDRKAAAASMQAAASPTPAPTASSTPAPQLAPKAQNEIAANLKGKLVTADRKKFTDFDASKLESKKYLAVYFSASWCGPCRRFTPKLVRFYNLKQKYADKFDVLFVSSDKTADDMLSYMNDDKMEWPAVRFEDKESSGLKKYGGRGIPCLVVIDEKGNVVADSYVNGQYAGPTSVMEKLEQLLKDS